MRQLLCRLASCLLFSFSIATPGYGAGTARAIAWEEMIPVGWDPMAEFKDTDLGMLEDTDPRAVAMMERMQAIFQSAPTNPALNGVEVKLPGYIVPLEENQGKISEFLLVPYYGACIHTPPPPANQIVHVKPRQPVAFKSMDTVWISGRLETAKVDSAMAVSGYRMAAAIVVKYVEGRRQR